MKALVVVLLLCLLSVPTRAGSEKVYGKPITVKEKTSIAEIVAHPEKYDGKRVLVEGKVADVCKKMGCWIMIEEGKDGQTIRFKVDDGVIVFPKDAKGKIARAEGIVSARVMSVEDQIAQGEHMAQEQGTKFDPSTVKGPKTVVQLKGEGAVIK